MGIEKASLLPCESIYWVNMNANIEEAIKKFSTCLEFQATSTKNKTMLH